MEKQVAISLRNISKSFGTIKANENVTMDIYRGEILSLLGENGSGKTTLMNMLSGIYYPDSGQIFIDGKPAEIQSPHDAFSYGIGMIHQHFKLVDVFTAVENVVLGLPGPMKLDLKQAEAKVKEICDRYGFVVDPKKKIYEMSVSEKQTLEIVKVLYRGASILILDEPTAVLTPQETEKLFAVMRNMKADGKSIIIITHKLNEVMDVSDRVAILRKGVYIGSIDTGDASEQILTDMMVGEKVELNINRTEPHDTVKRLSLSHISCRNDDGVEVLKDVSFDAYGGEILGVAGISGCGQKQLLEAIAGLQTVSAGGSVTYYDPEQENKPEELIGKTPKEIRELGVHLSFVPEDRLGMGLVGSMGMTGNMLLKTYGVGHQLFVKTESAKQLANDILEQLKVVTPSINTPVRRLSGGNVQKVLVGREIAAAPTVMMTAYAVRGLDINTSYTIYNLLNEQKEKGAAVIYVGEDLDALLALSDKVLVLCGGRVNGILDARTATKEEVGLRMTKLIEEA